MDLNRGKRRAAEQLSPYSGNEDLEGNDIPIESTDSPIKKRARAVRNKAANKDNLRGIFGSTKKLFNPIIKNYDDLLAGLNQSFFHAVSKTLETQANRNLRPLINQYIKYLDDIEEKKE